MPMKNIIPLTSACLFALCASLALTAPLYACDESVGEAEQAASTATRETSALATTQGRKAVQEAKQKAVPKKVQTGAARNAAVAHGKNKTHHAKAPESTGQMEKKKAVQKEKPPVKVANVDFKVLKERLKDTDAIGFFTKLAIRNDIVDLMDKIKQYRKKSQLKAKMKEIRSSFDGLLLKIIALLEGDPNLSRDLYVGRESIWESLLEVKA